MVGMQASAGHRALGGAGSCPPSLRGSQEGPRQTRCLQILKNGGFGRGQRRTVLGPLLSGGFCLPLPPGGRETERPVSPRVQVARR